MIYYIKFDNKYRLEISRYETILPEYNYTPIRLKTLATINAFFVLLNFGNKIKPILEGYTLKIFIPYSIIPIGDDIKFRNLIRKTRYHCHLNSVYCRIIANSGNGLYLSNGCDSYINPIILDNPLVISINKYYFNFEEILDAITEVETYLKKTDVIKYEEDCILDDGGICWLLLFLDKYKANKDRNLMRLWGLLALACKKWGWQFCVKHIGYKHGVVVQIFRHETDLYQLWHSSTRLGFTKKCISEALAGKC